MNYDFDKPVDRRNTDSRKFDTKSLNNIPEDATPLWIADMDFETAPCITHAFTSRTIRKTFNTALAPLSLHNLSPFAIDLVVAGYNEGDEWVDGLVSYIEGNKILIENFFKEHRLGLNVIQSEGTYLLWIDCRSLGFKTQEELIDFITYKAKWWVQSRYYL